MLPVNFQPRPGEGLISVERVRAQGGTGVAGHTPARAGRKRNRGYGVAVKRGTSERSALRVSRSTISLLHSMRVGKQI